MSTLIVDSNYIGHQARHTMKDLSHEDLATGVIYGFLSRILSLGLFFETNDLVFCWDSKHSYRKKTFPGYKKRPPKDEDEMEEYRVAREQFDTLRLEILPAIGFGNVFLQAGLEADDLMAQIALNTLGEFIIVTADEDLYQCIACNVRVFNPTKKTMMSTNKLMEEKGVGPGQWASVKTIGGCTSDTVPGLRGVGEKKAIEYITDRMKRTTPTYKRIKESLPKLRADYEELVRLPHPKTKPEKLKMGTNQFDQDAFVGVCEDFGLSSFLEDGKEDWHRFFVGDYAEEPIMKRRRRRR